MKKLIPSLILSLCFSLIAGLLPGLAEGKYKDSITWVIDNDQDTLDPQMNVNNSKVIPEFYEGLLGFDEHNKVVCKIAESYESSEDKMVWTFHLRDNVYFHSGRHCTAYDFEYTFNRLLNKEKPVRYTANYAYIESAIATDDYTFVITLAEPKSFFLYSLAHQSTAVLNPEYIEKYGIKLGETPESVDGCGPFKCTYWVKGEEMRFERFDNYYGDKALTREFVMKIVPEQTSRAIALETHQADIAEGLAPDDVTRLEGITGFRVSRSEGNGCHLFQFNCASKNKPMSNPLVRQAISYAIDRSIICEFLYGGLGEVPMPSIMAPSVAGYYAAGAVPCDVEKSKALLAEAGYPNGFEMQLLVTDMYNRGIEMGEIVKEMLGEVGITVNLEVVERAVFLSAWGGFTPDEFNEKFGWDMFIMGSGGDADSDTLLYRIMHTAENNLNNYGFYSNARVDELLEKGAVTMDEAERDACYAEIAKIALYEDPFGCYINMRNNVYVLSDGIENFSVSPTNTMVLNKIVCKVE